MGLSVTAKVELEGVNGRWFTLSGEGMGGQGAYLGTDLDGFYDAPVRTIHNSHAFQTGSTYGGKRNLQRDLVFGVWVTDEHGSWEENDSEWRKAWSYSVDAKLWITTETSSRYLKVRLAEHMQFQPERDPHLMDREKVVMTVVANDPWWYEPDVTAEWVAPTDTSGGTTVSGSIGPVSNPTDVPIWLKWTVQAPGKPTLPDFSFGDDRYERADIDAARKIVMPELIAGEHILVDTDEEAVNGQVNSTIDTAVYMRMNGVTFCYPIPPYTAAVMLPVSMSKAPAGVGVQVRQPRPWSRPWGLQ